MAQKEPLHLGVPKPEPMFFGHPALAALHLAPPQPSYYPPAVKAEPPYYKSDLYMGPKMEPLVTIEENSNTALNFNENSQSDSQKSGEQDEQRTGGTKSRKKRDNYKFVSVNNPALTEEQREMYESVLATWKPGHFTQPKPKNVPRAQRRYICHKCNKEFKNYQNLYLHTTRVHSTVEAAVACDLCDKTFKNKHYLYMHRMNKHYSETEKTYCQYCLQEFRTGRALHMHVKRIHPTTLPELKCPLCDKQFPVPYKLKYHMSQAHTTVKERPKCSICDKVYKNNLNLSRHMVSQHQENPRFPCVFCDQTFKSHHHMKRHVLNIHPPLESKVQCPECLKEFKNDQYLREHMQIHSSLEFKCDLCDKFFHSQRRLFKHKKIVHPTKPKLRCEKCNKEFAHPHYLKRHENSVHVEVEEEKYEHKCHLCEKKFKLLKYLNNHLQRHEQQQIKQVTRKVKKPNSEPAAPRRRGRPRKVQKEIEFIKCEPVSSSDESDDDDESESE
ncbi:hypothetical protein O0L34_g15771 [Tuta absoluta]|nr:hypothetical protein O0L34_g15771 [Tuta absoluta]